MKDNGLASLASIDPTTAPFHAWLDGFGHMNTLWNLGTIKPVIVVVGIAIAFGGVARAQGQTQNLSTQERSAGAEDRAVPSDTSTTNTATVSGIRLPFSDVPEIFGTAEVGQRFRTTSTDSGTRRFFGNVSGNTFAPVNPNAPWKVGGGFTYSTDSGTVARINVVGYRNYRMPLFMSQAIGAEHDLTLPLVSFTDLSQREVQWEIVAGVEKTFIRTAGGATIGAVADVFVPLNNKLPADTQAPPSITVRGGVKLGF
jgi:hypothetical protein